MNGLVLGLLLVCGQPTAMVGWGMPLGIGPFFGAMGFVEQDPEVNAAVQQLLANPDTYRFSFEFIPEDQQKFRCNSI